MPLRYKLPDEVFLTPSTPLNTTTIVRSCCSCNTGIVSNVEQGLIIYPAYPWY